MPSPSITPDDRIRLMHMLEAGTAALDFVHGATLAEFKVDQMRSFAVVRALEIVGEAANHLSDDLQAAVPEIEWSQLVGMRIILAHMYFDVDLDVIWEAANQDVPRLLAVLRRLLEDE